MCGIAACVDFEGRGRAFPWALPMLRHRGPDANGNFSSCDGNVSLEHCRLAVIDPTNADANQPFPQDMARWVMIYNGEVFNFRELATELLAAGVHLHTNSDTEVVLQYYLKHGSQAFTRFRGMFALVIWDRATSTLIAARDPLGVKPLYYSVRDGVFLCCSEIRPLLRHPTLEHQFDHAGVVEFLAFGNNYSDRTVIAGIRKLPPGHFLSIQGGCVSVEEYWDVLPPGQTSDYADALARLPLLLREAVANSLVSDVPIGLMLSAGLDSSTVATLAAECVRPGNLTAYSVAFGEPTDEAAVAQRLAADLGIRHRTIAVDQSVVRGYFDEWFAKLDYPSANPTWIATALIARAAHADGLKVLVSGDGADELFGGYSRWMKYLKFHDVVWRRLGPSGRRVAGRALRTRSKGLAGDISRRAAAGGDLFVPSRPFHDRVLRRCLGPAGLSAVALAPPETPIEDLRRRFDCRAPAGDYLAWMSYASLKTMLVEDYLQRLDKMGMQYSVEGRVPLLDPQLCRFAFSLSQETKIGRYREKCLFREAVAKLLPRYIVERPKQGFFPPIDRWATELLNAQLHRHAHSSLLVEEGLVTPNALNLVTSGRWQSRYAAWTLATLLEWSEREMNGRVFQSAATDRG